MLISEFFFKDLFLNHNTAAKIRKVLAKQQIRVEDTWFWKDRILKKKIMKAVIQNHVDKMRWVGGCQIATFLSFHCRVLRH